MIDLFKNFDTYSLRARVFPALIAGLPTLALLFVLVPWNDIGLSQAMATAMGFVLLFAFADVARRQGKLIEARLGTGATPELWHRSNTVIANGTKDRYRAYVAKQIKLPAPTAEDEVAAPQQANDFYISAGNWIREHTRDQRKFAILFAENITYGFRRNLLGLRSVALVFNTLVLLISGAILYVRPPYFARLPNIDEKLTVVIIAVVLHSAYMPFAVRVATMREASRTYGRQLLLSCETLMKAAPATSRTATKAKVNNDADR